MDEYEFATQAEVDAFWKGVEAAQGWNGYTVLEDGDIVLQDGKGFLRVDEDGDVIILDATGAPVERELVAF